MIKRVEMVLGGGVIIFEIGKKLRKEGEETNIITKSIKIVKGKIKMTFSDKSSTEYIGVKQYSIWK